jgi:hypothetical protein
MKKFYLFAYIAIAIAGLTLFSGCKEEEQKPLPADAGAISGTTENACPAKTVALSIQDVADATTYVWYRNEEPISDATTTSYTATLSGSYTVAGKNTEGEGKQSPVHAVTIVACPGEDGAVPEAAGAITAPATNVCPSRVVTLTVAPITGATSYSWAIIYAADYIDTTETAEPELVFDLSSLAVDQALTFTVSGVNATGYGEASAPAVVTRASCLPAKPVIEGNPDWIIEAGQHGDTVIYKTVCPQKEMVATAVSEGATSFIWYKQEVPAELELLLWHTDGSAELKLGTQSYTHNYAVVAVNNDGESERSNVIQVIGTVCNTPNRPGNANVALWPEKSGDGGYSFYPSGTSYSFGISNCDVQEKTYKAETTVELTCSAPSGAQVNPVTGYAFWVKTTDDGEFTKIYTAGTATITSGAAASAMRKIVVDGTTYPSGTYMVTAVNNDGDSPFGSNWIAVNIRNDCPAPPVVNLTAPTLSPADAGATFVNGVFSNVCPKGNFDITLTAPSTPPGNTTYKWTRTAPNPEVVQEGTQKDLWDVTPALNGSYNVMYSRVVGGQTHESPPTTFTIATTLCPPTFKTKPSAIGATDEYAEAVLTTPNEFVAPLISSYEWYYNNNVATTAEVATTPSSLTYHLKKEGTYKVRAKSTYGDSPFSEEITLTKATSGAAYTRADLIGTYSVVDYHPNYPSWATDNYTLTIAAGEADDAIIITGLGNGGVSPVNVALNATVTFTNSGPDDYGTITIPNQRVVGSFAFTKVSTYDLESGDIECSNDALVLTIKSVGSGLGVSQTGLLYGIVAGNKNPCGETYLHGNPDGTSTWTKQ